MNADLILTGGEVLDPGSGLNGKLDVAIRGGRIMAVGAGLATHRTTGKVLELSGSLVLPGLIDIHTHCYWGGTFWGVRPDPLAAMTGVTTWVDAGSAGAWNLAGFRELAETRSQSGIRAFINISGVGLTAMDGELDNLAYCDSAATARVIEANRDFVVGIKVRMGSSPHGILPLELAIETASRFGLPVMVHIANGLPQVGEVLARLRRGDIVTHCYTARDMRLVSESGLLLDAAREARKLGVLFDVGHGRTAFAWRIAEAAIAQGFGPDLLSTDIHQLTVQEAPNMNLSTTMTKFLHLGLPLSEVVRSVTERPATVIGLSGEVGTLRPGARADIAIFDIEQCAHELLDAAGESRTVARRLRHLLTIVGGHFLPEVPPDPPAAYIGGPDHSLVHQQTRLQRLRGDKPINIGV